MPVAILRQAALPLLLLAAQPASAAGAATAADKAVIEACVKAAAAGKAAACIGRVSDACMNTPDGQTTAGMNACLSREIAVWDERLNAHYAAVLAAPVARQPASRETRDGEVRATTGADLIRATQRAWIAFRDAKCSAAQLTMEGGTGMGPLGGDCLLQETARQALWLAAFIEP